MKKLISVLLALALLLAVSISAAETAEASLLGSIKMGVSSAEIADIMGTESIYASNFSETVRDEEYVTTFAGLDVMAGFVFIEDSLKMIVYYSFPEDGAETLAAMKQTLTAAYGEPAEVTPEIIATLFTSIGNQETPADLFSDGSAWAADSETAAWAFKVDNGTSGMCYVIYVAADYLATLEIPAGTKEETPKAETGDIEGSWKVTDVLSSNSLSGEELEEARGQLERGEVVMVFTFRDGRAEESMTMYGVEQIITGTYVLDGNKLTLTQDNDAGEMTLDVQIDGDTMIMNTMGIDFVFTRQN